MQKIYIHIRKYFLSGLLLVVPLVVTIYITRAVFNYLDSLLHPYLGPYFEYWIPGLGIIITLAIIYLIGLLVTNYLGRKLVIAGEHLLLRIPFAKSVYGSAKQIVETFSKREKQSAKKVVLVEYPKKDIWSVGFINGTTFNPQNNETLLSILVLTSMNPTSGFLILVPQENVTELDVTVEDAIKWIVSGGIVTPEGMKRI